jgi:hypothetical protein
LSPLVQEANAHRWHCLLVRSVPVALHRHPRGDMGVVLGYLAKMDRLHHLTLRGDQLLLDC